MRYLIFLGLSIAVLYSQTEITTVFVVRHAEKIKNVKDPSLSKTGKQRADQIRYLLKDAGISGIYSTMFKRNKETAAPLAKLLKLNIQTYDHRSTKSVVDMVMTDQRGKTVLVVGHSNTVNKLVEAFGGIDFGDLDESKYDFLYQLSVQEHEGKLSAKMTTLNTRNTK